MKHYLTCPFEEEDMAIKSGAKYEKNTGLLYFTNYSQKNKFIKWLPDELLLGLPDISEGFGEVGLGDALLAYYLYIGYSGRRIIEFTHDNYYYTYNIKQTMCNMEICQGCKAVKFYNGTEDDFWNEYEEEYVQGCASAKMKEAEKKCYKENKCEDFISTGMSSPTEYFDFMKYCDGGSKDPYFVYIGRFANLNDCRLYLRKHNVI